MTHKHKRLRGVPELHDELKRRVNISLTPTGVEGLDVLAAEWRLSRSELIEQIGRGQIRIAAQQDDAAESELPVHFGMSALHSIQLKQCDNLPTCSGAYVVVDPQARIYGGYCFNLRSEFQKKLLLKSLKRFFQTLDEQSREPVKDLEEFDENLYLFWIECRETRLLKRVNTMLMETLQKVITEEIFRSWLTQHLQHLSYPAS
jgi:hypothetical protein